jgi:hypothetical protein
MPTPADLAGSQQPAAATTTATPTDPAAAVAETRAGSQPALDSTTYVNVSAYDGLIDHIIATDEPTRLAQEFARTFVPSPDPAVDYKWVIQHAKDRHAACLKNFDEIDAKAASLAGYFGGGAGALAVGSLAGLSAEKGFVAIAIATVPSFVLAIVAMIFAILARQRFYRYNPSVRSAARYANDLGVCGEIQFVGQWVYATALTDYFTRKRSWYYNRATWLAAASIASLIIPLAVAIVQKL